jgi:hypothetical protein
MQGKITSIGETYYRQACVAATCMIYGVRRLQAENDGRNLATERRLWLRIEITTSYRSQERCRL